MILYVYETITDANKEAEGIRILKGVSVVPIR